MTHLILCTVYPISTKHHTPYPKIAPCTLLHLTLQGDTSSTFPLVTGRTVNGFYFRLADQIKILRNKYKFPREKKRTQPNRISSPK
jgi:hypothetical protein